MFIFSLPRAKNSVVSIRKRFKLRGGSYQKASHALTCLRSRVNLQKHDVKRVVPLILSWSQLTCYVHVTAICSYGDRCHDNDLSYYFVQKFFRKFLLSSTSFVFQLATVCSLQLVAVTDFGDRKTNSSQNMFECTCFKSGIKKKNTLI